MEHSRDELRGLWIAVLQISVSLGEASRARTYTQ
jgi:hypothetical protein